HETSRCDGRDERVSIERKLRGVEHEGLEVVAEPELSPIVAVGVFGRQRVRDAVSRNAARARFVRDGERDPLVEQTDGEGAFAETRTTGHPQSIPSDQL